MASSQIKGLILCRCLGIQPHPEIRCYIAEVSACSGLAEPAGGPSCDDGDTLLHVCPGISRQYMALPFPKHGFYNLPYGLSCKQIGVEARFSKIQVSLQYKLEPRLQGACCYCWW